MNAKNTRFTKLNCLTILLFQLSFSVSYSQIDVSKELNNKKFKGNTLSSKQQGDYIEESKLLIKKNDTITFLYNQNIAKAISIKNELKGISTNDFHKYAIEVNPKFRFNSKIENRKSTVYFNEEKNLANVKIYSDSTKSKVIEIGFVSDQKLLQILISDK